MRGEGRPRSDACRPAPLPSSLPHAPFPFLPTAHAFSPCSEDKSALSDFFNECNGVRWLTRRNWLSGEPCGAARWHGVTCVGGRVTELTLGNNNVACWGKLNLTALAR